MKTNYHTISVACSVEEAQLIKNFFKPLIYSRSQVFLASWRNVYARFMRGEPWYPDGNGNYKVPDYYVDAHPELIDPPHDETVSTPFGLARTHA